MAITRQTVLSIAELARLNLREDEIDRMLLDLGSIMAHVAELEELDTSQVPPTLQLSTKSWMRPDEQRPGLTPEQALSEAPRSVLGGFAVPGFVDES